MTSYSLGVAKVDITPPVGGELQGYGALESTGVLDPLYAKALVLKNPRKTLVVLTCDLVGISSDLVADIRRVIGKRFPVIRPKDIMVCCSHAHSTPATMTTWHTYVGYDRAYFRTLIRRTTMAVAEAVKDLEPVTMGSGSGRADFNINRRLMTADGLQFAPNPDGPCDKEVQVVRFDGSDGRVKAILFNYACHSTAMGGALIHTDYPGAARRVIERALPGAEAFFTLGACGDVRPMFNRPGSKTFGGGTIEAVEKAGAILGREVIRVARKIVTRPCKVLKSVSMIVKFPLERPRSIAELKQDLLASKQKQEQMAGDGVADAVICQETINSCWARAMLKRARNRTLHPWVTGEFQAIQCGDLVLVGLPGEIFCEYGLAIKKMCRPRMGMVASLSNDCINYFPTARALREGGFEPDCYKGFYLPARFSEKMEAVFLQGARRLVRTLG